MMRIYFKEIFSKKKTTNFASALNAERFVAEMSRAKIPNKIKTKNECTSLTQTEKEKAIQGETSDEWWNRSEIKLGNNNAHAKCKVISTQHLFIANAECRLLLVSTSKPHFFCILFFFSFISSDWNQGRRYKQNPTLDQKTLKSELSRRYSSLRDLHLLFSSNIVIYVCRDVRYFPVNQIRWVLCVSHD